MLEVLYRTTHQHFRTFIFKNESAGVKCNHGLFKTSANMSISWAFQSFLHLLLLMVSMGSRSPDGQN